MKWYWSKYPTWVKVLVIFAGIIGISMALWDGFVGSIKYSSELSTRKEPVSDASRKASTEMKEPVSYDNRKANTETTSNDLKIKGFYLGMNIDEAVELLNSQYTEYVGHQLQVELLIEDESITPQNIPTARMVFVARARAIIDPNTIYVIDSNAVYGPLTGGDVHIEADGDKKVTRIAFSSSFSNKLFNSIDMDIETFIENFKKAYRIPDFKLIVTENNNTYMPEITYEYSSPDGYKITISSDKSLEIKVIPKPTERGFD